jgi:hypothetical protein
MDAEQKVYSIVDLEQYAISLRDAVAKTFKEHYSDNLDEYISINQVISVIEGYSVGNDDDGRLLITEEIFEYIFDDVRDWFYEVGLSKLAAKGLVECAWDNETNSMIFWIPNNEQPNSTTNHKS